MRYCDDGHFAIENNRAENTIRSFVLGRKNGLFSTTVAGAKAIGNLCSLIETNKASGLESYSCLRDLLTVGPKATIVEDIEALLPCNCDATGLIVGK